MSGVLFAVLPASIVASAHVSRQAYYPSLFMCYDILGGKEIRLMVRRFSISCAFILAPLTCFVYPICYFFVL
ncbi:hypothetical protein PSV08DRAFT_319950 [Bipolaris maydis]|uniref:uncharacterized protein n=1 Tax=Cochliobolus heterostrophus TaxID=5016 RepID=UPI0024D694CC|nr:hypothetical protein PSV08DRAFT_319950 [Bipolaris maydis]KAJ6278811.1 hypothetical protein J3E71DRAFT_318306 [Bipolaris maydis]